jgi:phosphoserine phosphatase
MKRRYFVGGVLTTALALALRQQESRAAAAAEDPLPSWNKGRAKNEILDFVACAVNANCGNFIPVEERIAVFDNDGTLWCEQPMYVQAAFIIDRLRHLAVEQPDLAKTEPFAAVLKGDLAKVIASGEKGLAKIVAATHGGMTTTEFERIVTHWLATTRHPRFDRPYTELIYQPMLEVLAYIRANQFKTYIVSGGGAEFMRPFTEKAYGIPPEQVVGSTVKLNYELRDDKPVLMRTGEVDFVDDHAGKPVGIQKSIGRQPVLAFGNSDGDYEMLRWASASKGPSLGLIVHHTDAEREYAYDRNSAIGKLARALDEAPARGWTVVDMKRDWKTIFPPAQ